MRKIRTDLLVLSIVLLAQIARAEPQLIAPSDPAGKEIRAEAAALLRDIATHSSQAARARFSGLGEQRALLDAMLAWSDSSFQLQQTIVAKLKVADAKKFNVSATDFENSLIDLLKIKYIVIEGDSATIAAGGLFDEGFSLQRIRNNWQVTELSLSSARAKILRESLEDLAKSCEQLQREVTDGKLASMKDFQAAFAKEWGRVLEDYTKRMSAAPAVAIGNLNPIIGPPPTIASMRSLLGRTPESKEFRQWLATLNGLPIARQTGEWTFIASSEHGVSVAFFRRQLMNLWFYTQETNGFRQYVGELPDGLTFNDRRQEIERKLGAPPEGSGGGGTQYEAAYRTRGVYISYLGDTPRDPKSRIATVMVTTPDPTGPPVIAITKRPRLTLRLIADDKNVKPNDPNIEMLIDTRTKKSYPVYRQVVLDETAFARVIPSPKELKVHLQTTDDGAKALLAFSTANVGKTVALVLDGELLLAATLRDPLSKYIQLTLSKEAKLSDVRDLSGKLSAAIYAMNDSPVTGPATQPTDGKK